MAAGVASPTPLNVLAGIAGQGGTPSLAWFADLGSTLPTDATTALDAAFKTPGYVSESGLTLSTATNTQDINAFGVTTPVRTLITGGKITGKIAFLETNVMTQAIHNRLPLSGAGSPTLTGTTGALSYAQGPARVQSYAAVFAATDGVNLIRKVVPNLQVTDTDDLVISQGAAIVYGVTFTAFPDSNGNAVYTYIINPNLKTS